MPVKKTDKKSESHSNPVRKEGTAKVTGRALYVDDLSMPEMLYGVTVRSAISRGRIKRIEFDSKINWDEYTVVTAKDITGKNAVTLLLDDQPFLAELMINHAEEPVLLVAHKDKSKAFAAKSHINIEYDVLTPVYSIEDALARRETIWGKDNIFKEFKIEKGNIQSVFNSSHLIVEAEYETGAQEQLYIENNGVIATASEKDGVIVWGSMQCPYYVQKALKTLFDFPAEKIRIIQTETGGGFGGKEEYPSILSGHAALLAMKSGKPVKMIYDRMEDMVATTKRHPSKTKIRIAVSRDGKLKGIDFDFILDGGAYCTLSPVVLSRGGIHAAGPYYCENTKVRARAVATNTPPHGAFRGFGAPQSIFAMERHMDLVAKKLGISPDEFRRINLIEDGQRTSTGQLIQENVNIKVLMEKALDKIDYHNRKHKYQIENKTNKIKRGVGFACFMHGAGFTGSGEKYLASIAGVEVNDRGEVVVLASSTEIGQGTNTVFSKIASDVLNISYDYCSNSQPDTARVPNSGPTVASRTVMVVGKLVEQACEGLKQTLYHSGFLLENYSMAEWIAACKKYISTFGVLKSYAQYKQPSHINWDETKYQGDAYVTYAWAVYAAQVAIDTTTFEVTVEDFVALQDVGKVFHPIMAEGQIEGGVAQAIGFSLYEKVAWKDGRMANNTMTNYIMPTSMDVPPIRVYFENSNSKKYGPQGAKGIGELPMDGVAPAILNAVDQATGGQFRFTKIPLTPEEVFHTVKGRF